MTSTSTKPRGKRPQNSMDPEPLELAWDCPRCGVHDLHLLGRTFNHRAGRAITREHLACGGRWWELLPALGPYPSVHQ